MKNTVSFCFIDRIFLCYVIFTLYVLKLQECRRCT